MIPDYCLRCDPGPFRAVWRGRKRAELRLNDRQFEVGDRVDLLENDKPGGLWAWPYRHVVVEITHVLRGGQYGLSPEWCMWSFKVLRRAQGDRRRGTGCASCNGKREAAK